MPTETGRAPSGEPYREGGGSERGVSWRGGVGPQPTGGSRIASEVVCVDGTISSTVVHVDGGTGGLLMNEEVPRNFPSCVPGRLGALIAAGACFSVCSCRVACPNCLM